METKIIKKSKIIWIINSESIIAADKLQATCYNSFMAADKQPFMKMREKVLWSKENELNSWIEVIGLAQKYGIIGYGTRVKKDWLS